MILTISVICLIYLDAATSDSNKELNKDKPTLYNSKHNSFNALFKIHQKLLSQIS